LLTGHERLRPETFAKMWNSLIDTGDGGVLILQAFPVKEELRSLLRLAGTNPERDVIRARLDSFYQSTAATDAPEVHRLSTEHIYGGLTRAQRRRLRHFRRPTHGLCGGTRYGTRRQ
jgi:hypothetical protein